MVGLPATSASDNRQPVTGIASIQSMDVLRSDVVMNQPGHSQFRQSQQANN